MAVQKIDIVFHQPADTPYPATPIGPNTGINTYDITNDTALTNLVDQENVATGIDFSMQSGSPASGSGGNTCTHARWNDEHISDNYDYTSSNVVYILEGFDANEPDIDLNIFCSTVQSVGANMELVIQGAGQGAFDNYQITDTQLITGITANASGEVTIQMIKQGGDMACINCIGVDRVIAGGSEPLYKGALIETIVTSAGVDVVILMIPDE
jgi:hypothetical protein